jgi:hypothetical protein
MGVGFEVFLFVVAFLSSLAAAAVSWLCVKLMPWEGNLALRGGAACGCVTSIICGVGLYLLLELLPGRPGGGNPWGAGGRPTIAAALFIAGTCGAMGVLVGSGIAFPFWLSDRLASGDVPSAESGSQSSKISKPDSTDSGR